MRSSRDIAPWAYLGGILLAVPSFTDRVSSDGSTIKGILRHLPHHLYGRGSFDHGNELDRFAPMLAGPTTLGTHLRKLWRHARQKSWGTGRPQDQIPQDSLFAVSVKSAGFLHGEICSKPQHQITAEVEARLYHTIMLRCSLRCASQSDIPFPVVAFLSTDRMSQHFVGLPTDTKTT